MAQIEPELIPEVLPSPDDEIIRITNSYWQEARDARIDRIRRSKENVDAYHNKQDFSHKIDGQSKEFIPKVSVTVEQFAAFIKRALTMFGDWFSVELPDNYPISDEAVRKIIKCYTNNLPDSVSSTERTPFEIRISDGVKVALLESLMIFKVHGNRFTERKFKTEEGKLNIEETSPWRLQIDLISPTDYYPDPTGRGLYEIHQTERDLHEIVEMTKGENPTYDPVEVGKIVTDFKLREEEKRAESDGIDTDRNETPRRRVVIREGWGTILNPDGTIKHKNVFWTTANEKYLIRKPMSFPFWHGQSPFEKIPLIRVPFSVWHKAVYDQVVPLNLAQNELFNLILDGGISSVWGIKQVRLDWLEDPSQVAGGIPQGATLALNETAPADAQALTQITSGKVPPDALATYNLLDREANSAAMTNDIKQGLLPPKEVKATEIIESQQNSAITLDSISRDIERFLENVIKKAWMVILQNFDLLDQREFRRILTLKEQFLLTTMSKEERFSAMAADCTFKVFGLSATLTRTRDFQRLMALLQISTQNPLLAPSIIRRYSPDKILDRIMKSLNINPSDIEKDDKDREHEAEDAPIRNQLLQQQVGNVQGQSGVEGGIGQETQPSSGT